MPPGKSLHASDQSARFEYNGIKYEIRAYDEDSMTNATWLLLKSTGWQGSALAHYVSEKILDCLRLTLSIEKVGADLGERVTSAQSLAVVDRCERERPVDVLYDNDTHGVMIFDTEKPPRIMSITSGAIGQGIPLDRWLQSLKEALEGGVSFDESERTAFDLVSASCFVRESPEARLALLCSAVEALLQKSSRPEASQKLIGRFIEQAKSCQELSQSERDSLLSGLGYLMSKSIRARGVEYVKTTLGDRVYHGQLASDLFADCYDLRSAVLHARRPRPSSAEVITKALNLEQLLFDIFVAVGRT